MAEKYLQHLTPFQKDHLKQVCKRRWLKLCTALVLINGLPVIFALVFNIDLFETLGFIEAIVEILRIAFYISIAFFPVFIVLWIYLLYVLFTKIIPLQRDIIKGQKMLSVIPADKYKMDGFNQFFIRTQIKNYPFLKINEWIYNQIPNGIPLIFESTPRSAIYLGLRSAVENEVILTENPESVY